MCYNLCYSQKLFIVSLDDASNLFRMQTYGSDKHNLSLYQFYIQTWLATESPTYA